MGEWHDMDSVCIPSLDQVNGFDFESGDSDTALDGVQVRCPLDSGMTSLKFSRSHQISGFF
jgi:hypothetical protein